MAVCAVQQACLLVPGRGCISRGWNPGCCLTHHIPSAPQVHQLLLAWLRQQPRTVVLQDSQSGSASRPGGAIHARAVSLAMGYADDLFIGYRCEAGRVVVEGQSQLRIGVGDMEVNPRRLAKLMLDLQAAAKALPEGGSCG